MMQTINISLPSSLYDDLIAYMKQAGFASVSEVTRHALRKLLGLEELTANGFTPQAEKDLLEIMKEPPVPGLVFKSGDNADAFFEKLYQKGAKLNAS